MNELLALADLLEEWAGSIPRWDPRDGERWDIFADRRYEAERALRARLRRLPTCVIRTDPALSHVEFALAGIGIEPRTTIDGACRAWAAEARRRAEAWRSASPDETPTRSQQESQVDGAVTRSVGVLTRTVTVTAPPGVPLAGFAPPAALTPVPDDSGGLSPTA